MRAAFAAAMCSLASVAGAGEFRLDWPVACTLGLTCHVQNYVDRDPGPGAVDFAGGPLVYDTHKGTDIALPSLAAMADGVAVLAAAPGTVRGIRDEMPDQLFTDETASAIEGRECGNGVVLVHPQGWETQYCHMKQGSITVVPGQQVQAGAVLGQIGLSGLTQFPHLHLTVRKDGQTVDPFVPAKDLACCFSETDVLWADPVAYQPGGIIAAGFAAGLPDYDSIKAGDAQTKIAATDPALVLWAYVFGGRAGDAVTLDIAGPDGFSHRQDIVLDRTQAQLFRASGLRLRAARWPAGDYVGTTTLTRAGTEIDRAVIEMTLP